MVSHSLNLSVCFFVPLGDRILERKAKQALTYVNRFSSPSTAQNFVLSVVGVVFQLPLGVEVAVPAMRG